LGHIGENVYYQYTSSYNATQAKVA